MRYFLNLLDEPKVSYCICYILVKADAIKLIDVRLLLGVVKVFVITNTGARSRI